MGDKKKKYPSDLAEKFLLRFPDGLRDRIKRVALLNRRSMGAEIIYRLEKSLAEEDASAVQSAFEDE